MAAWVQPCTSQNEEPVDGIIAAGIACKRLYWLPLASIIRDKGLRKGKEPHGEDWSLHLQSCWGVLIGGCPVSEGVQPQLIAEPENVVVRPPESMNADLHKDACLSTRKCSKARWRMRRRRRVTLTVNGKDVIVEQTLRLSYGTLACRPLPFR